MAGVEVEAVLEAVEYKEWRLVSAATVASTILLISHFKMHYPNGARFEFSEAVPALPF